MKTPDQEGVLEILREHRKDRPAMSAAEIAAHLEGDVGRVTVLNLLRELMAAGKVDSINDGSGKHRYSLLGSHGTATPSGPTRTEQIIEVLRARPDEWLDLAAIASALRVTKSRINSSVVRLHSIGTLIRRPSPSVPRSYEYKIPADLKHPSGEREPVRDPPHQTRSAPVQQRVVDVMTARLGAWWSVDDLVTAARASRSGLPKVLSRLYLDGVLARRRSPEDGRAYQYSLPEDPEHAGSHEPDDPVPDAASTRDPEPPATATRAILTVESIAGTAGEIRVLDVPQIAARAPAAEPASATPSPPVEPEPVEEPGPGFARPTLFALRSDGRLWICGDRIQEMLSEAETTALLEYLTPTIRGRAQA